MSSQLPRTRIDYEYLSIPATVEDGSQDVKPVGDPMKIGPTTSKLWRSEGHPINRKTGKYDSGGPFHVTHSGAYLSPSSVNGICRTTGGVDFFYSGPSFPVAFVGSKAIGEHYSGATEEMDESSMNSDGATAISQCAPTNPTANLGVTLAETFREGIPSLPGIQSWKRRTEILKGLGSEYLNYQFGWAPLVSEVHSIVSAARNHRDILQNYRHNEGRDVHRRFDFPSDSEHYSEEISPAYATGGPTNFAGFIVGTGGSAPSRVVSVVKERKRWFEGCFTYGGPSQADNFGRALGFGSNADAVFGLALDPEILWELTPWSWAIDWFTNAQDVISNVRNFALAGLVMRYGYMMTEHVETYSMTVNSQRLRTRVSTNPKKTYSYIESGPSSIGFKTVSKSRIPANPFGFGVGWEGLSPTQLAITAALGITRLL